MSDSARAARPSIYRHMLSGSVWALAMRWSVRALGLISVAILARLLTPEDFGIVAMGALLIGLIDGFAELGTAMLLLRRSDVTRADCDTAWTLRLIQGVVIAAILIGTTPLAVRYFSEPRLEPVIYLLAAASVITGLGNIGMTLVRKELDFAKDFRFGIYQKIATFVPTVGIAIVLRDYWALAVGNLIGVTIGVGLSYRMHSYRPRLSLEKAREYLEFSVVVVGANIARFLKSKVDVFVIGGTANAATMGAYNVASELSTMATQEIVIPVWRGLFPTFAKITSDHERFITAYGYYLSAMAILCLPLGMGLWSVAPSLVPTLLGPKWDMVVPSLQWLAICATLVAMIDVFSGNILFVSGHERRSVMLIWVHLALLVPAVVYAGVVLDDVVAVAMAATIASAITLPLSAAVLMRSIRFPVAMVLRAVWRPVVSTAVMTTVLIWGLLPAEWPALVHLLIQVPLGAAVYAACLMGLWMLAGRPEGPENLMWQAATKRILPRE